MQPKVTLLLADSRSEALLRRALEGHRDCNASLAIQATASAASKLHTRQAGEKERHLKRATEYDSRAALVQLLIDQLPHAGTTAKE